MLLVKKKTGENRIVQDYRKLNHESKKDATPLRHINNVEINSVTQCRTAPSPSKDYNFLFQTRLYKRYTGSTVGSADFMQVYSKFI